MEWNERFMTIFREMVARYHEQQPSRGESFVLLHEREFLECIGYTPSEMFEYVAEYATQGVPVPSTILLIAAVRRSFFLTVQRGIVGREQLRIADIPGEDEMLQDIVYLPRMIKKAEAKLHGTLPVGMMYFCDKDREFLREHGNIHPADFLNVVWGTHGNRQKVISYILRMTNAQKKQQEDSDNQ